MKYAPREVFDQILEWAVIPTFDLILEVENEGFLLVKRKITPYKNQWALPGLRMYKGEEIDEVLVRIAKQEVGLDLDPTKKVFIGQYVGKFKTEHGRQDLSTGYYFKLSQSTKVTINPEHFSSYILSKEVPKNIGTMYKFYLKQVLKVRF